MNDLSLVARSIREFFELSQIEAAKLLKVSNVHLCNVENGKANISNSLIARYRDVFGADIYVLAWCNKTQNNEQQPLSIRKAATGVIESYNKSIAERKKDFQAKRSE